MRRLYPFVLAVVVACGGGDDDDGAGPDADIPEGHCGDPVSDSRMDGMVEAHNVVRATATPAPDPALPPVCWSAALEAAAQEWASNCIMAHDPDSSQGENWAAWSAANDRTSQQIVGMWVDDEGPDYDYDAHTCNGGDALGCGHYTQIVWRDTAEIGCALQVCPNGLEDWADGREIWICRYMDPGNWFGERPY
jgi:hypothetical protein